MKVTIPYTPGPSGDMHIGVVAHNARAEQAHALKETVGAVYLSMSNGNLSCEQNHRKVWDWLATKDSTWSVVLEDDCEPVEGFREQLEEALAVAPAPIVGLYLGTGTPHHWQDDIRKARQHHPDAHWYVSGFNVINAVGLCIRTKLLPLTMGGKLPADQAIANWCRTNHHKVAYANPSLLDHLDGPSVITERIGQGGSTQPRKAWHVGTRTHWTSKEAPL